MYLKWIKMAQYSALTAVCLLALAGILLKITQGTIVDHPELKSVKRQLPKSSFEFAADEYIHLKATALTLTYMPPQLRLPDLRNALIYYGQNGRPDMIQDTPKMFFGMQGGKSIVTVAPHQKIYLSYDKTCTSNCKYTFSPKNEPTMVWFTGEPEGKDVKLSFEMSHTEGIAIASEDANRNFSLSEKEFIRPTTLGAWELGKWRVDGSLLVRQKARWAGVDKFLENHGGTEFPDFADKHRIDFNEGDEPYSVYLKRGDYLVWDEGQWKTPSPKLDSRDKPLLAIKKIDEKVMVLDVWDTEGKGKVALTLIKAPENFRHEQITRDFKFVGARTKTQVVFQIEDERLIVKPNDWLLQTKEGWKKLATASEIDDYVSRKLVGPLFIFQEIAKKDDKSILIGSIYNPNRTELHEIEVAMLPAGSVTPALVPGSIPDTRHQEIPTQAATPIATH